MDAIFLKIQCGGAALPSDTGGGAPAPEGGHEYAAMRKQVAQLARGGE